MSSSNQFSPAPSYPSWILVEVHEELNPKRLFFVIHATQVVGNFTPNLPTIHFYRENRQYSGIVLVVSEHRRYVEQECQRMIEEERNNIGGVLWGLVRVPQEAHKVRLTAVNYDSLRCEDTSEGQRTYLLEFVGRLVPVELLHTHESQKGLRDLMAYIKEMVFRSFACRKKVDRSLNLNRAYLLVQYYEDSLNLIFTIVSYGDTIWKDRNRFPMVVAYIPHGEHSCQSIILRMSYDLRELLELLDEIRNTCERQDYFALQAQLMISDSNRAKVYSRAMMES